MGSAGGRCSFSFMGFLHAVAERSAVCARRRYCTIQTRQYGRWVPVRDNADVRGYAIHMYLIYLRYRRISLTFLFPPAPILIIHTSVTHSMMNTVGLFGKYDYYYYEQLMCLKDICKYIATIYHLTDFLVS